MAGLDTRLSTMDSYELGPVTSSNSVLAAPDVNKPHCALWHNVPMQNVRLSNFRAEQTLFFPDYSVVRSHSRDVVLHSQAHLDAFDGPMESQPWETMWANRPTKLFFIDVADLS